MKTVSLITALATVTLHACAATEAAKPVSAPAAAPAAAAVPVAATAAPAAPVSLAANQPLPANLTQLTIIDRAAGDANAAVVAKGSPTLVHYTGWLYDASKPDGKGAQFDSSRTRVAPFSFIVGVGKVIKGWDQGVIGMRVGGKRTLLIPAHLAYGERARPNIPANSNLLFDIEIINIIATDPASDSPTAGTAAPESESGLARDDERAHHYRPSRRHR
jgi:FKBP-type peptidyl-prolyl cis-trans isomerase FkpA